VPLGSPLRKRIDEALLAPCRDATRENVYAGYFAQGT
jgi:hypothetical protein